jgi:hypothetical protein
MDLLGVSVNTGIDQFCYSGVTLFPPLTFSVPYLLKL